VVLPEPRDKCRDLLVDFVGRRLGDGAELLEGDVNRQLALSEEDPELLDVDRQRRQQEQDIADNQSLPLWRRLPLDGRADHFQALQEHVNPVATVGLGDRVLKL
jgi:hypothetical protein